VEAEAHDDLFLSPNSSNIVKKELAILLVQGSPRLNILSHFTDVASPTIAELKPFYGLLSGES